MSDSFIQSLADQVSRAYREGADVRLTARSIARMHFPNGGEDYENAVSEICSILGKRGGKAKKRPRRPSQRQLALELVEIRHELVLEEMDEMAETRGDHLIPEDDR